MQSAEGGHLWSGGKERERERDGRKRAARQEALRTCVDLEGDRARHVLRHEHRVAVAGPHDVLRVPSRRGGRVDEADGHAVGHAVVILVRVVPVLVHLRAVGDGEALLRRVVGGRAEGGGDERGVIRLREEDCAALVVAVGEADVGAGRGVGDAGAADAQAAAGGEVGVAGDGEPVRAGVVAVSTSVPSGGPLGRLGSVQSSEADGIARQRRRARSRAS